MLDGMLVLVQVLDDILAKEQDDVPRVWAHGTLVLVHGMLAWVAHKLVLVDDKLVQGRDMLAREHDRLVLECDTHALLQIYPLMILHMLV